MSARQIQQKDIHPFLNGHTKKLLIDGKFVDAASGKTFQTINPANGQVLASVAQGDFEDIDRAVASARRAFEGEWSKWKPAARQRLLLRIADLLEARFDEFALLDTLDMGAPLSRTMGIRHRAVGMLRYYAGLATSIHGETIENSAPGDYLSYTVKEPVGVVGGIIPWNSPIATTIWKIAPAIASGCTMVLKPAEEAPLTPLLFAELLMEAGVPNGVINVVPGFGETAGAALSAHPGVDKVAFTGSGQTAQHIIRASAGNFKRLSMELGGKSPDIVFADADLDAAVAGAAMAVFGNAGQVCCAGTRLFVERGIHDEFVERVSRFAAGLRVGNGAEPGVDMGPLVSRQQFDRVTGYFKKGREAGARVATGAERIDKGELEGGFFVAPTVFADVKDQMEIAREEIFGPVISAMPFDDIEEVIRRGNDTEFGLGCGVWTRDVRKAHLTARAIRAGTVWVNCYNILDPALPFGGYKASGYGREGGVQHMDEFLQVKTVWVNLQ